MAALLPYLAAVLCGAVPLWLYLKLRAELRDFKLEAISRSEVASKEQASCVRLDCLEARLDELKQNRNEQADWISQAESLNLNRRGQVLRLHRRGESVSGIASALRMKEGEVKLMIKVHELGRNFPAQNSLVMD